MGVISMCVRVCERVRERAFRGRGEKGRRCEDRDGGQSLCAWAPGLRASQCVSSDRRQVRSSATSGRRSQARRPQKCARPAPRRRAACTTRSTWRATRRAILCPAGAVPQRAQSLRALLGSAVGMGTLRLAAAGLASHKGAALQPGRQACAKICASFPHERGRQHLAMTRSVCAHLRAISAT
eukprot:723241-Pleurochrysis_carterae.AAC.4